MRLLTLPVCFVVASAGLAGCPAKVVTVEVTPPKIELRSDNQSKQLQATPKDADGNPIEGEHPVSWKSADLAVVTVTGTGLVKPTGSGQTTITATIDEQSAMVPVSVVLLKRIQLRSPAMVIVAGVPSEPLVLNFMNERGEPIASEGQKVSWKIADSTIATVSNTGVVTGIVTGSTLLSAEVNDLKAEMTVTVNPPPEPVVTVPEPGAKPLK